VQGAIVTVTKSTKVTRQQVLIGGTLFHLLPDIAEGSSDQLNQGLTSIVLIVISLMVTMDAVFEFSHRKNNESNKVSPNTELPTVSNVHNAVAPAEFPIPIRNASSDSSHTANRATDGSLQLQPLSYSALLKQPDVATNLLGEALHNLNDGIAIAAAFSLSWASGMCQDSNLLSSSFAF
jgi:zinc transporter ZupT